MVLAQFERATSNSLGFVWIMQARAQPANAASKGKVSNGKRLVGCQTPATGGYGFPNAGVKNGTNQLHSISSRPLSPAAPMEIPKR